MKKPESRVRSPALRPKCPSRGRSTAASSAGTTYRGNGVFATSREYRCSVLNDSLVRSDCRKFEAQSALPPRRKRHRRSRAPSRVGTAPPPCAGRMPGAATPAVTFAPRDATPTCARALPRADMATVRSGMSSYRRTMKGHIKN
ncbi:unnamed protein product [Prorocentrum cordatum]|uniref:Uncharacterized protein n=1 Tax=Prorocentrum cordatum TaxID=2364126 RepID=A0ABN9P9S0_9DINO|nr:unnamed protein product [Polarella glacialis]